MTIGELTPRNPYEQQVLSRIVGSGKRIVNYHFPKAIKTFNSSVFKNLRTSFLTNKFVSLKEVNYSATTTDNVIECDLYVNLESKNDELITVKSFLSTCTEWVKPLGVTSQEEAIITPNSWVLIEISEDPYHLSRKLYQLERAMHCLPHFGDEYKNISAVICLINGDEDIAKECTSSIALNSDLKISKIPVFVGWVPTRNIFSSFRNLEKKFDRMQENSDKMQVKFDRMQAMLELLVSRSNDGRS